MTTSVMNIKIIIFYIYLNCPENEEKGVNKKMKM